ncbi:hypothetical protein GH810_09895 [Acetobacterium paludosum]|uniref:Type IV toxin-antitoxin system AbiEi family antitoxin domain-containing protein n=1 Tax=Acetobacterium paludosum TaxID=52693 RepID=A0A923KWN7_9FIRM|nr:DUF6088 family protein [Acetobacterium paludosum]MBC3888620.1 hypothetical protein [Acetobacterium paludosum]
MSMLTIDEIKSEFEPNTPIFLSELENKNEYSSDSLRKFLSRMARAGVIKRFQKGVYYIPEKTIFGESSLNPVDVIKRKYLGNGKKQYGVMTGLSLLNKWGLTTQVPNVIEIVTNNETNRKRTVEVGNQRVILRCSKTPISEANIKIIEFLEAVSNIDFNNEEQTASLRTYLKTEHFSRANLDLVLINYSKKTYKKLVESGMINEFA